jgi:hypothetical protein
VAQPNALRWNHRPGHYEVYYLTLTDRASGIGIWVRYTLEAPLAGDASCALWFAAMDPASHVSHVVARKQTLPIDQLKAERDPFRLQVGEAELTDTSARGAFEDVSWDLHWRPGETYHPVPAPLRPFASTVLVLAHGEVPITGRCEFHGHTLELSGARGAQTHLWGSKHAESWAWARCGDLQTESGDRAVDSFIDGVSPRVKRFGRELGPALLLVGRIDGVDFRSSALRASRSTYGPDGWSFETALGRGTLVGEVKPDRRLLAGVTYHDPDGEPAYCYNSEAASMRLELHERGGRTRALIGDGTAHFEYGQRQPLSDLELHLT